MSTETTSYISVRQRLRELNCSDPEGLTLLPANFENANSVADLRQSVEAVTVKKLLKSAKLPYSDILPPEKRPPYLSNHAYDWVGPTIFIAASLLESHGEHLSAAFKLIADYVIHYFVEREDDPEVTLSLVVETKHRESCKKLTYSGPAKGLRDLPEIIRDIQDE